MTEDQPSAQEQLKRVLDSAAINRAMFDAAIAAMNAQASGGGAKAVE